MGAQERVLFMLPDLSTKMAVRRLIEMFFSAGMPVYFIAMGNKGITDLPQSREPERLFPLPVLFSPYLSQFLIYVEGNLGVLQNAPAPQNIQIVHQLLWRHQIYKQKHRSSCQIPDGAESYLIGYAVLLDEPHLLLRITLSGKPLQGAKRTVLRWIIVKENPLRPLIQV